MLLGKNKNIRNVIAKPSTQRFHMIDAYNHKFMYINLRMRSKYFWLTFENCKNSFKIS